jgi:SAM-dependent methyltransferase
MRSLFKSSSAQKSGEARTPRHSSGWTDLLKHLRATESLRILDIGATSANNINFLTDLGHSVYMANFVEDAMRPEWRVAVDPSDPDHVPGATRFDIEGFVKENLDFADRRFDVITLWDTLDYLPAELVAPVVDRLYDVLSPGGKLLAFFHTKVLPNETYFVRYHLTGESHVEMQKTNSYPIVQTFQNRQIERTFHAFSSYRFFLAKDNLQEVIATR